jgi:hypothetical protein
VVEPAAGDTTGFLAQNAPILKGSHPSGTSPETSAKVGGIFAETTRPSPATFGFLLTALGRQFTVEQAAKKPSAMRPLESIGNRSFQMV